jgi:hypothetical protein
LSQPGSLRVESPHASPTSPRRTFPTGCNNLPERQFIAWAACPSIRTMPERTPSQFLDPMPKDVQPADSPMIPPSSKYSSPPAPAYDLNTPPPEDVPPWRNSSVKRQREYGGSLEFPRTPSFHSMVAGQRSGHQIIVLNCCCKSSKSSNPRKIMNMPLHYV